VAPDLVTTEVLGLQIALARPAVELTLDLQRLNGDLSTVRLLFPGEISALTLKAFATTIRIKPTDIVDIWRCLEICLTAGIDATAFSHGTPADAAVIIRGLFGKNGPGMQALTDQQRLSKDAADRRYTWVRALMARLLTPNLSTDSSRSARSLMPKVVRLPGRIRIRERIDAHGLPRGAVEYRSATGPRTPSRRPVRRTPGLQRGALHLRVPFEEIGQRLVT